MSPKCIPGRWHLLLWREEGEIDVVTVKKVNSNPSHTIYTEIEVGMWTVLWFALFRLTSRMGLEILL